MRIRHSLAILLLVLVVPGSPCLAVDDPVKPPGLTYLVAVDISGSMNDPLPAPVQADLTRTSKLEDVRGRLSLLAQYLPAQTRVIVTTFDHNRQLVCDLTLESAEDRRRLENAFASIKSQDGSTFLWRTADDQLKKAERIAMENPESRVRVLLYTDGDDMEKAPGMDHESLIRKYGNSLQSVVELDWVTLGYDLRPNIKSALSGTGVRFTEAKSPADLVPLRAGFQLSATDVKYGESISLLGASTFNLQDVVDGKPLSIFIVIPPNRLHSHRGLLKLYFGVLMTALLSRRKSPPEKTLIILDECAQLESFPLLETLLTLSAGYGVRVHTFWQDLSQLLTHYPTSWKNLLNNSAVLQTFGIYNRDMATQWGSYLSRGPGELRSLQPDEQILSIHGHDELRCRKLDFLQMACFAGLSDQNGFYNHNSVCHAETERLVTNQCVQPHQERRSAR